VINFCPGCFEKQRQIDALTEEVKRLKARLNYLERKEREGYFGSSTPSSQVPIKSNAPRENQGKRGGARPGHRGHGRQRFDESGADRIVRVESEVGNRCPRCGGPLEDKGIESHGVIDIPPLKTERILYQLPKRYCPRCQKSYQPPAPGVLPRSLYGNQLVATVATLHYLHGIPMGRITEQIGIGLGPLVKLFHRLAKLFSPIPNRLIEPYRHAPVKHADETGWRNDGQSGYVWLFATDKISLFLFRKTRSSSVPREVFGDRPLPGTLVVDRYNAYNKVPCQIQYCYAHLLREVEEMGKEFSEVDEVKTFVGTLAPLLAQAMHLRSLPITDAQFYEQAEKIKSQIREIVHAPAQHLAIRRMQELFHDNEGRLYHWAKDRRVPADNNLAERDLRPTVIARKVSFGSQSDTGAQSRGVLMTTLHTLKKQSKIDVTSTLKTILDQLSKDPSLDPYPLLFPNDTS